LSIDSFTQYCRVVIRGIAENGGAYDTGRWLKDYVKFMTTPGSHNDTYAESFHRDFFANYARGVAPDMCAIGTEGHNTAQIGAFVVQDSLTSEAELAKPTTMFNILFSAHTTLDYAQSKTAEDTSFVYSNVPRALWSKGYFLLCSNCLLELDRGALCR
jgi:hypothetical protein